MSASQNERVLAQLRKGPLDAVAFQPPNVCDGGKPIWRVAARVGVLKDRGFVILSERRRDGTARYRLVGEPERALSERVPLNHSGLCECGCGEQTPLSKSTHRDRGQVEGQPIRFCPGHHRHKSPHEYLVDEETGCWVWQRGRGSGGYGALNRTGAHRIYFERFKGPIPAGLQIDHLCRNRACVNPDHLEAVSSAENTRRGSNTILTDDQVREIRADTQLSQRQLAHKYGMSRSAIRHIRAGRRRKVLATGEQADPGSVPFSEAMTASEGVRSAAPAESHPGGSLFDASVFAERGGYENTEAA